MIQFRKIAVPTDFSPCATVAVDRAAGLARQFGSELLLVHVVPDISHFYFGPELVQLPWQWTEQARVAAEAALAKEQQRLSGVRVTAQVLQGPVHESILAAATSANADLIVIGTHGRRGLKHAFLGSVAERVVRESPIAVMTVRGGG